MQRELGEGHTGADRDAAPAAARQPREFRNPPQTDERLRFELPALHVGIQIGASGHGHAVGARFAEHTDGFLERAGRKVGERGQAQHQRDSSTSPRPASGGTASASVPHRTVESPSTAQARASSRAVPVCVRHRAPWAPPPMDAPARQDCSHPAGGSTVIGGRNANAGTARGPTRPGPPFTRCSRAASTLSGEIGTSSMRTPTASYTALATAGMTGSSGPWPASLAPNGPSGSSVSTRIVSTGGISRNVGLLYSSIEGILWRQ